MLVDQLLTFLRECHTVNGVSHVRRLGRATEYLTEPVCSNFSIFMETIMPSTTDDIGIAMGRLNEQLAASQKKLKRIVGSRHESVSVHLWEIPGDFSADAYLEFGELDDGNEEKLPECLKVVDYIDGDVVASTEVNSLPISKRICAAMQVPELIELALAANDIVIGEAIEAADAIEQMLAKQT